MLFPEPFFDYDYTLQLEVYVEAKEPLPVCSEFFIITSSYFYRYHIREYLVGTMSVQADHFINVLIVDQNTEQLTYNILPLEVHISYRHYDGSPEVYAVNRGTSAAEQRIMDFRNFVDDLSLMDD
jgi:hypothetical protein